MVLNGTGPRGAAEAPDRVLASPARWFFLGLMVLAVVAGFGMAVGGLVAPLGEGETRSIAAPLLGLEIAILGGAGVVLFSAPSRSRPLPPARAVDGSLALPVRSSYRGARAVALLAVGAVGATGVVLIESPVGRVVGALTAVAGVVFAVLGLRESRAIRVDPTGVRLPPGITPSEHIAWRDVVEVAVTGGWQPKLFVTWRGPGLSACHLLGQAWPPSAIVATLDHYGRHASDRVALDDPESLDRFRD